MTQIEPRPLWPPLLTLTTPTGVVPFYWDGDPENIIPFDVTRTSIRRSELDALSKKLGLRIKDPAKCTPKSEGDSDSEEDLLPDSVVGYRFAIKTLEGTGLPYNLAHHIRVLEPLHRVTMRTNWVDRTRDQTFIGLYVEDDPDIPYLAGGSLHGQEYYPLNSLTLVTILEAL